MVLPMDSYTVYNKSLLTDLDFKVLGELYQPIIGDRAVCLYCTLVNDLKKKEIISEVFSHHHLINVMQCSLNSLEEAKEKLEAVGLLEVYLREDNSNNYIYVLYNPLSYTEFLNHPILNVLLYNTIGKEEYQNIVNFYKVPKINLKNYKNISKRFDEVFSVVATSSYFQNEDLIYKEKAKLNISEIDFDLLLSGIGKDIINEKLFTKEVKELITNLAFIYNIDISSMQSLIIANLTKSGSIDKEALRKSARNFYQFNNQGGLPTLVYNKKTSKEKKVSNFSSNKEKMLYIFENTSPYLFIKSKYKDGKVILRDLQLIESLLVDLKLPPEVVNVLLDYVLKVNNQKLNKAYVLSIASNWKRLGIKTALRAMEECINEYKKKNKNSSKVVESKKKLPDWFNKKIAKKDVLESEEKELKEMLENLN